MSTILHSQQFESDYIFGTAEPLCLDPSPAVTVIKNNLQRRKNPLHTRAVKRSESNELFLLYMCLLE